MWQVCRLEHEPARHGAEPAPFLFGTEVEVGLKRQSFAPQHWRWGWATGG